MTYQHVTAPTRFIETNGIRFAYRRFGQEGGTPLLFMQHFRGGMDHWDPAVTDGFAKNRPVILFDNAGVASSQVAETPEKEPQAETLNKETQLDKQPAALNRRSSRMPAIVASVSALVAIGAAAIYALPNFNIALPNFSSSAELFSRATASAPIPDPTVTAALKDIQSSQQIQLRFSRMESFCSKTQLCCCKVRLLWNPLGRISQLSRRI